MQYEKFENTRSRKSKKEEGQTIQRPKEEEQKENQVFILRYFFLSIQKCPK
jgi:hypothetical protein